MYFFLTVSMIAGAIRLRVDIFTAPNNATTNSNQGTVAAKATENFKENNQFQLFNNIENSNIN